jgi:hypothetical protein
MGYCVNQKLYCFGIIIFERGVFMRVRTITQRGFGILGLLLINGCGGGSGGSSDEEVLTGRFLDSACAGLSYSTESRSGITNANGEFTYLAGETVVFGLGDLDFPAVTAAHILTPLENGRPIIAIMRATKCFAIYCNQFMTKNRSYSAHPFQKTIHKLFRVDS